MSIHFNKGSYENVLSEKDMKIPILNKKPVSYFPKEHYIYKSDNKDDFVIKNAIEPLLIRLLQLLHRLTEVVANIGGRVWLIMIWADLNFPILSGFELV